MARHERSIRSLLCDGLVQVELIHVTAKPRLQIAGRKLPAQSREVAKAQIGLTLSARLRASQCQCSPEMSALIGDRPISGGAAIVV